jgi:hypothetical protein
VPRFQPGPHIVRRDVHRGGVRTEHVLRLICVTDEVLEARIGPFANPTWPTWRWNAAWPTPALPADLRAIQADGQP